MTEPVEIGFLEDIINVSFGGALLRLDCEIFTRLMLGRSTIPSPPTISFKLDNGEKIIDSTTQNNSFFIPGSTEIVKTFFIWSDIIPRPANGTEYRKQLAPLVVPTLTYGDQFSQVININSGGFLSPEDFGVPTVSSFPGSGADGGFDTLAHCQAYADAWNAAISSHPVLTETAFDINHVTVGPFSWEPVVVASISETNVIQSQSEGRLVASYLIKVPDVRRVLSLIPGNLQDTFGTGDGASGGTVFGKLYNPAKGKKLASLSGTIIKSDGDFMHSTANPRVLQFTITSNANKKTPVLIVDGGGGGGVSPGDGG